MIIYLCIFLKYFITKYIFSNLSLFFSSCKIDVNDRTQGCHNSCEIENVKLLLQKGYKPNLNYIKLVCENGNYEIIKLFKNNGICFPESIIDDAISNVKLVQYLFSLGYTCTEYALDIACYDGYLETVKYLFSKGIKPTDFAMDYACRNGHFEVIQFLISQGIKPSCNAINYALINKHYQIVNYLNNL